MTPRERIEAALAELGTDEADVLALVAERLAAGRKVYGELQLATDRRDFRREALEEIADALVYAAAGIVRTAVVRTAHHGGTTGGFPHGAENLEASEPTGQRGGW